MAEIIIDLDEVEVLCKSTRAEYLQAEVGQLRELFFAAQRWRIMRNTFTSMRNSLHPTLRYQALGTPSREARQAEATFWSILAELELEAEMGLTKGKKNG